MVLDTAFLRAELFSDGGDGSALAQQNLVDLCRTRTEHCAQIVLRLLFFAKVGAGTLVVAVESLDLTETLASFATGRLVIFGQPGLLAALLFAGRLGFLRSLLLLFLLRLLSLRLLFLLGRLLFFLLARLLGLFLRSRLFFGFFGRFLVGFFAFFRALFSAFVGEHFRDHLVVEVDQPFRQVLDHFGFGILHLGKLRDESFQKFFLSQGKINFTDLPVQVLVQLLGILFEFLDVHKPSFVALSFSSVRF